VLLYLAQSADKLNRLDRWWRAMLDPQIEDDEAAGRVARNVEVAVKLAELLGINARRRADAAVDEVTQIDVALAGLVREA
jgi:hypothetical protein